MAFTLVFPSNAQPETYHNSAAEFQTDLQNPIDLNGEWEVALQDISYVNNIKTISNQSVMLGYTRTEHKFIPHLEEQNKLLTYNLQHHASEWNTVPTTRSKRGTEYTIAETANTFIIWEGKLPPRKPIKHNKWKQKPLTNFKDDVEQWHYHFKISRLLNVLNRLAPEFWLWQLDSHTDKIHLLIKSGHYDSYGFYVSEDLGKLLSLKTNLFLPKYEFDSKKNPVMPLVPIFYLEVSYIIKKIPNWDKLDLKVTVLPLHRMSSKVITFKEKTVGDLMKAIEKQLPMNFKKVEDGSGSTVLFYNGHIDKGDVAYVTYSPEFRETFNIKPTLGFSKQWFQHKLDEKAKPKQCSVRVVYRKVKPAIIGNVTWSMRDEVKIPAKHYSNGYDLCTYLNKGDKSRFEYEFSYDNANNFFKLAVRGKTVVSLSSELTALLGFPRNTFYNETLTGKTSPLDMNINHFYIYTNFIQSTEVGGHLVPLLRYIPIDNTSFGKTMYKEFTNKVYVPVNASRLHHCEFGIFDDTGRPIQFIGGRTVLTLHFRKRS